MSGLQEAPPAKATRRGQSSAGRSSGPDGPGEFASCEPQAPAATPVSPAQTAGNVEQMIAQMQPGVTPPRRGRSQASLPDTVLSPPPGCHIDELHAWAKRMFLQVDGAIQTILKEQQAHRIKIDKFGDVANTSEDTARRLKGVESGAERALARANEAVDIAEKSARDGATAIHGLRGELSGFAAALEASSKHIAAVEAEYRSHVSNNFQALEVECRELRAMSTFAAASVAASGPPGTGSASSGYV